jgi:hypothetical protein
MKTRRNAVIVTDYTKWKEREKERASWLVQMEMLVQVERKCKQSQTGDLGEERLPNAEKVNTARNSCLFGQCEM